MEKDYDYLYKLILVGDTGVGKTNLLGRYIRGEFELDSKSTIGVEFITNQIMVNDKNIKVQIWDTAGQERYRGISRLYYRGAIGCLLVYDISKKESFDRLSIWLTDIKQHVNKDIIIMIIGNKQDLNQLREVSIHEGIQFSKSHNCLFMETSALNGSNVQSGFIELISNILVKNNHDINMSSHPTVSVGTSTPLKLNQSSCKC